MDGGQQVLLALLGIATLFGLIALGFKPTKIGLPGGITVEMSAAPSRKRLINVWPQQAAWLTIKQKKKSRRDWTYPLSKQTPVYIGSSDGNQIKVLGDSNVVARHTAVFYKQEHYHVGNQSTLGATYVHTPSGYVPVREQPLGNGSKFRVGNVIFIFHERRN